MDVSGYTCISDVEALYQKVCLSSIAPWNPNELSLFTIKITIFEFSKWYWLDIPLATDPKTIVFPLIKIFSSGRVRIGITCGLPGLEAEWASLRTVLDYLRATTIPFLRPSDSTPNDLQDPTQINWNEVVKFERSGKKNEMNDNGTPRRHRLMKRIISKRMFSVTDVRKSAD